MASKSKAEKKAAPKKRGRKSTTKKDKKVEVKVEEINAEETRSWGDVMEMPPLMRFEYRAVLAEWQAAAAESRLATAHATAERSKPEHQYLLKLLAKEAEKTEAVKKKAVELAAVQHKLASKFGLKYEDLKDYVIDTDTGRLTYVPA